MTAKTCKTPTGRRPAHTWADEPHPSIKSVIRVRCTGCGKVLTWKAA